MKQVVQHLRSGDIRVDDVPAPALRAPGVLIATQCSVISPGTERAALEIGRSSLLGKALRRPDQVRKVLDSLRRDGISHTYKKVQHRLDTERPMGYSCAGIVLEARGCGFAPGARVACAGTDAATHAEINFVPRNLCAEIPAGVSFEEAGFVALGGIALHAVHLASPQVGEDVAVLGLGPVGLLLVQVLRAAGCRVAGFDLREDRLALARSLGSERTAEADRTVLPELLRGWGIAGGFDRVFIAAASQSSAPVEWAVEAAGDRAQLIVVGDVRTDLNRAACYAKELSVVYARSYGPGRYDANYEEEGIEYPRGQVRWSLQRNLAGFLDLVARRQVQVAPLITHRFAVDDVARAYEVVSGAEPSLGVVLTYSPPQVAAHSHPASQTKAAPVTGKIGIGCIGAGNYAGAYLLPALQGDARAQLVNVATSRGLTARKAAADFGFARCTTDATDVLSDPDCHAIVVATRHDSHAELAARALKAGKHVFVEKPLALNQDDLERIEEALADGKAHLMLGHNRRFAPATQAVREFFADVRPLSIHYAVHAAPLPENHWLRDPAQGGRLLGEVCHFVDWCLGLVGAPLRSAFGVRQGEPPEDAVHAVLNFADGTVATVRYDVNAHSSLPKEHIEISAGGRTAIIDNFAHLVCLLARGRRALNFRGKGQEEMMAAFLEGISTGRAPITSVDWVESARAILKLQESVTTGLPVWFPTVP